MPGGGFRGRRARRLPSRIPPPGFRSPVRSRPKGAPVPGSQGGERGERLSHIQPRGEGPGGSTPAVPASRLGETWIERGLRTPGRPRTWWSVGAPERGGVGSPRGRCGQHGPRAGPERRTEVAHAWLANRLRGERRSRDLARLEALGPPPYADHRDCVRFIQMVDAHGGGMDVGFGPLAWAALRAPE